MTMLTASQSRRINELCSCTTLDRKALEAALSAREEVAVLSCLPDTHPHLFADVPVFVAASDIEAMQAVVAAVEAVATLPDYRDFVFSQAPDGSLYDPGPKGALMGYDFHLGEQGPQLIEINTNAGGAFLNSVAHEAQRYCCAAMQDFAEPTCPENLSARLVEMFATEWQMQRTSAAPSLIAIVDDIPEEQYLYPELLLARSLLEAHGMPTVIVDASELSHSGGRLRIGDCPIDLVYNRLVDFDLSEPRHAALRDAYLAGDVVVTPNPHHHALFANKRNLTFLSDPVRLEATGVLDRHQIALRHIPPTRMVTADNAEQLWSGRRRLFFKPVAGHGSKAVYRGDKLTRKTWASILSEGYVAQERATPTERLVPQAGDPVRHKMDLRLFTYQGDVLLVAARLYQGQTTNFRTSGGGFSPVFVL